MNNSTNHHHQTSMLNFWVIGDLHFRDQEAHKAYHTVRMQRMFDDLRTLWQGEEAPAFYVSPGDIIDTGSMANYALAKQTLAAQLGDMPFYPGIGNHDYYGEEEGYDGAEAFTATWNRPIRYAWTAGPHDEIVCIMLEQPDATSKGPARGESRTIWTQDALDFLDATLTEHSQRLAIIFAHCPLWNTVLDRDPARNLDDDSLQPFFFVENSEEVRATLARHKNAALYISGHTHSGWGSPQMILTEMLGGHPVTHINVSSPWYTGFDWPPIDADVVERLYQPEVPDPQVTFAFAIYADGAIVRARSHRTREWLAEWRVPFGTVPVAYSL